MSSNLKAGLTGPLPIGGLYASDELRRVVPLRTCIDVLRIGVKVAKAKRTP